MTPHKTLLNHKPPSKASSGSSTKSANGFSSNTRVNQDPAGWLLVESGLDVVGCKETPWEIAGVIFKNALKPI